MKYLVLLLALFSMNSHSTELFNTSYQGKLYINDIHCPTLPDRLTEPLIGKEVKAVKAEGSTTLVYLKSGAEVVSLPGCYVKCKRTKSEWN